ncbi:hypothetical protein [Desulfocicer niacini]
MENDIILIYVDDQPVTFARIEHIRPDIKNGWFVIKLLMLQIPLQVVSWILKADYINGDSFFMSGQKMRMEKVVCPVDEEFLALQEKDLVPEEDFPGKKDEKKGTEGDVLSFARYQQLRNKD